MKYMQMQYMEPRLVSIEVEGTCITGELSGSFYFVKFKSQDARFTQWFPAGSFDTMFLNLTSCSPYQLLVIETAQQTIRSILQDA